MSGPAWFTPQATERHTIVFPGAEKRAAELRATGEAEAADVLLESHTCWVEMRGLTAGERALFQELQLDDRGRGKLAYGDLQLKVVETCLVAWSLPLPLTPEAIRQLDPGVFDLMFAAVPGGAIEGARGGANGSGPPPPAATPPAEEKDAARVT
jgi:hypothetical protein